jgi:hypothetical protein
MPPSEPSRVFISYARKDGAALAQRLRSDLTKQGFDAWLDTERIAGGAVWSTEIEREIDTRQVTLALLSPGSYESGKLTDARIQLISCHASKKSLERYKHMGLGTLPRITRRP